MARILFLERQSLSRSYGFRSADVREWAVAYESAHAECTQIAAMCVLLKLKSFQTHATHQTCLRSGWLQNTEQVSALVNIHVYSSMVTPIKHVHINPRHVWRQRVKNKSIIMQIAIAFLGLHLLYRCIYKDVTKSLEKAIAIFF